jgi:hypothetical protein
MPIKINLRKSLTIDGKKMVSLKIDGLLSHGKLPVEYTSGFPAVWLAGESVYVHTDNQERQDAYRVHVQENSQTVVSEYLIRWPVSANCTEYLVQKIQESGARLHEIMKKHRRDAALYDGECDIII